LKNVKESRRTRREYEKFIKLIVEECEGIT